MKKNLFLYLIILLMTFCFTYIFECNESKFLLYIMIFIPIIDLLSILTVKKSINISMAVSSENITKNQIYKVKIMVKNNGIIPMCFLKIILKFNEIANCDREYVQRVSLGPMQKKELCIDFKACHVGRGIVNLYTIQFNGVFCIFTDNIDILKIENKLVEPRILNIVHVAGNLKSNNNSSNVNSLNSFIGNTLNEFNSEYKAYIQGERLNLINWKIFSKKGELVSRKSVDYKSIQNIIVVLDSNIQENRNFESYDELYEVFISIINYYFKINSNVRVYFDSTNYSDIKCENDIKILKTQIAEIDKSKASLFHISRLHNMKIGIDKNSLYIVVTGNNPYNYQNTIIGENINVVYTGNKKIHSNERKSTNIYSKKIIDNECIIEGYRNV